MQPAHRRVRAGIERIVEERGVQRQGCQHVDAALTQRRRRRTQVPVRRHRVVPLPERVGRHEQAAPTPTGGQAGHGRRWHDDRALLDVPAGFDDQCVTPDRQFRQRNGAGHRGARFERRSDPVDDEQYVGDRSRHAHHGRDARLDDVHAGDHTAARVDAIGLKDLDHPSEHLGVGVVFHPVDVFVAGHDTELSGSSQQLEWCRGRVLRARHDCRSTSSTSDVIGHAGLICDSTGS